MLLSAQKQTKQPKKLREVKIYLVKATEVYDPKNPANLFAVRRRVDAASPLHATLRKKQSVKYDFYILGLPI